MFYTSICAFSQRLVKPQQSSTEGKPSPLTGPAMTCTCSLRNHIRITSISICAQSTLFWPRCWSYGKGIQASLPVLMMQPSCFVSSKPNIWSIFQLLSQKRLSVETGHRNNGFSELLLWLAVSTAAVMAITAGQAKLSDNEFLLLHSSDNLLILAADVFCMDIPLKCSFSETKFQFIDIHVGEAGLVSPVT